MGEDCEWRQKVIKFFNTMNNPNVLNTEKSPEEIRNEYATVLDTMAHGIAAKNGVRKVPNLQTI